MLGVLVYGISFFIVYGMIPHGLFDLSFREMRELANAKKQ